MTDKAKIHQDRDYILHRLARTKTGTAFVASFQKARVRELINRGDLIKTGDTLVKITKRGRDRALELAD